MATPPQVAEQNRTRTGAEQHLHSPKRDKENAQNQKTGKNKAPPTKNPIRGEGVHSPHARKGSTEETRTPIDITPDPQEDAPNRTKTLNPIKHSHCIKVML